MCHIIQQINTIDYYKPYEKLIVMDIDDTISFADTYSNLDVYSQAKPNMPLIETMIQLANEGYSFVLYTARGWISCKEDTQQADKKYRKQIESWLQQYNVPYKQLIFGKPYGILYVDDKAMRPDEFINKFRNNKGIHNNGE